MTQRFLPLTTLSIVRRWRSGSKKTDLKVEFSPSEQPYVDLRSAILDITQNNDFLVTSTREAFGQDGIDPNDTNPLLRETDETISGQVALIKDVFVL